jgi:hypothetical protein
MREKTIAIIQSSYIPWKGYFDIIRSVDEFVFLDTAQYTKRDWRNRNRIVARDGIRWLTIPVASKGRYLQRIDETEVAQPWARRHWQTLAAHYARAPHFGAVAPALEALYAACEHETRLSRINFLLIAGVCRLLGIATPLRWSSEFPECGTRADRLVSICRAAGATRYLSGPSAAAYLEPEKFARAGVALAYVDYAGYPAYPQLQPGFVHEVSIVDMLFCLGMETPRYLRSLRHAG